MKPSPRGGSRAARKTEASDVALQNQGFAIPTACRLQQPPAPVPANGLHLRGPGAVERSGRLRPASSRSLAAGLPRTGLGAPCGAPRPESAIAAGPRPGRLSPVGRVGRPVPVSRVTAAQRARRAQPAGVAAASSGRPEPSPAARRRPLAARRPARRRDPGHRPAPRPARHGAARSPPHRYRHLHRCGSGRSRWSRAGFQWASRVVSSTRSSASISFRMSCALL